MIVCDKHGEETILSDRTPLIGTKNEERTLSKLKGYICVPYAYKTRFRKKTTSPWLHAIFYCKKTVTWLKKPEKNQSSAKGPPNLGAMSRMVFAKKAPATHTATHLLRSGPKSAREACIQMSAAEHFAAK